MFGLFRRNRKQTDPLRAFDGLIEDLDRQGLHLRRSAATLLALKGELTRSLERYEEQRRGIQRRAETAAADLQVSGVLARDLREVERLAAATREALARTEEDGKVLLEASEELSRQLASLKLERTSASARYLSGAVISDALKEQVARFDKVVAVDAARDEVERAHQLAEIYRAER